MTPCSLSHQIALLHTGGGLQLCIMVLVVVVVRSAGICRCIELTQAVSPVLATGCFMLLMPDTESCQVCTFCDSMLMLQGWPGACRLWSPSNVMSDDQAQSSAAGSIKQRDKEQIVTNLDMDSPSRTKSLAVVLMPGGFATSLPAS